MSARLGIILLLTVLAGCVTRPVPPNPAQVEALRVRAETHFAQAFYVKPAEPNAASAQAVLLAPLLLIEAPGTNASLDWQGANVPATLFFQAGQVQVNAKRHEQVTYCWTYPCGRRKSPGLLRTQGVRITLNSAGLPVIWEVLADGSGAELVFVARSLEAQALREFGVPEAGRKFAVERSLAEAPTVVVARVIEDGPIAMGPILYLRAGGHDVTTVICRCMDSQARGLAGQHVYDLQPWAAGHGSPPIWRASSPPLRLPADF